MEEISNLTPGKYFQKNPSDGSFALRSFIWIAKCSIHLKWCSSYTSSEKMHQSEWKRSLSSLSFRKKLCFTTSTVVFATLLAGLLAPQNTNILGKNAQLNIAYAPLTNSL